MVLVTTEVVVIVCFAKKKWNQKSPECFICAHLQNNLKHIAGKN